MKKMIPLLFVAILTLCGCTAKSYTPVVNTDFSVNAVYKTGDFSYNCKIVKKGNVLSVTPTSTRAKGMSITYDGRVVTFSMGKMVNTFDKNQIDPTNPAIVLYQAFTSIEDKEKSSVRRVNDTFQYSGETTIGSFVLVQNDDNSLSSLTIPNADIKVTFV